MRPGTERVREKVAEPEAKEDKEKLEQIRLAKYKQEGDDILGKGYYCPLVRTNPRSGVEALNCPPIRSACPLCQPQACEPGGCQ